METALYEYVMLITPIAFVLGFIIYSIREEFKKKEK